MTVLLPSFMLLFQLYVDLRLLWKCMILFLWLLRLYCFHDYSEFYSIIFPAGNISLVMQIMCIELISYKSWLAY